MACTKYLVGEKFKNTKGLEFEIIEMCSDYRKRKIRFLNSGYVRECYTDTIKSGKIHDYLEPCICGVGIMDVPRGTSHILHSRWVDMISRCYDTDDTNYKTYGAKGCYVDDNWLIFSNYVRDIENKDNYDKLKTDRRNWNIDKDILIKGNKCYSNETTLIVSRGENTKERLERLGNPGIKTRKPVLQYSIDGKFISEYKSLSEASINTGIDISGISSCCRGESLTAGKYIWKFKSEENNLK